MCAQICEEKLGVPVSIFREAQNGGQDAVFLIPSPEGEISPTGTVQVKHSSDAKKKLAVSDLTQEIDHLKQLIIDGQADTYIFITNMTVDAQIAKSIRKKLQNLGVKTPHVWGKDEITLTIKSSSKLRALAPQVYGLGDLSAILDQRAIAQTKAILEDWLVKLKAYVSTNAHDKAVRALVEHGAVLLLGNPSSGKSTIGAILSAMAAENENHSVIQISSPQEFIQHWNPDDKGRFFWIDDAFGPNTVSNNFVQDWALHFNKIPAAIKRGNRFCQRRSKNLPDGGAKVGHL